MISFFFAGLVQLFTISATSNSNLRVSGHIQMFARPLGATTVVFALIVLLIGRSPSSLSSIQTTNSDCSIYI